VHTRKIAKKEDVLDSGSFQPMEVVTRGRTARAGQVSSKTDMPIRFMPIHYGKTRCSRTSKIGTAAHGNQFVLGKMDSQICVVEERVEKVDIDIPFDLGRYRAFSDHSDGQSRPDCPSNARIEDSS
jgi:hypothetical protein